MLRGDRCPSDASFIGLRAAGPGHSSRILRTTEYVDRKSPYGLLEPSAGPSHSKPGLVKEPRALRFHLQRVGRVLGEVANHVGPYYVVIHDLS
jgi:hypothetical protein